MRTADEIAKHLRAELRSMILRPPMYGSADRIDSLFHHILDTLAFIGELDGWRAMDALDRRHLFSSIGVMGGGLSTLFDDGDRTGLNAERMAAVWSIVAVDGGFLAAPEADRPLDIASWTNPADPIVYPTDAIERIGVPAFSVGWDVLLFRHGESWAALEFQFTPPREGHWSRSNAPASSLVLSRIWSTTPGEVPEIVVVSSVPRSDPPTVLLGQLFAPYRVERHTPGG